LLNRIKIFCNNFKELIVTNFKTQLLKVFFTNSVAAVIKLLARLISNKVVAIYLGPTGIAAIGQLANFTNLPLTVITSGICQATTQKIAENKENQETQNKIVSTALFLIITISLFFAIIMLIFNQYFTQFIFNTNKYDYVLIIFSFSIIFFSLNQLFLAILNGLNEFKKYVLLNLSSSIISVCLTVLLVILMGLKGAFIALVTFQAVIFFLSFCIIYKLYFKKYHLKPLIDINVIRIFFEYTLMTLTSSILYPLSQLTIRTLIIKKWSIYEAGIWESLNSISNMILVIITTSLAVYYLPKLSSLKNDEDFRAEVISTAKFILPVMLVLTLFLTLIKNILIPLLYSSEFILAGDYLFVQMLGNVLKVAGWLIAYRMIVKKMTLQYIIVEILFTTVYVLISFHLINLYGVEGAVYGYACAYLLYLFMVFYLINRELKFFK